jgi:NAD(P)-dependent dehydrogenase (short-subunit alcohol dehydrogenase family)
MTEFEGLVAVVTGGGSGIGAAAGTLLRSRGAKVASFYLSHQPEAPTDLSVQCDVGDSKSVAAAIAAVVDRFGGIDIVVNNAGIGSIGSVADATDDEWHQVLNVNVVGIARVSRAALPYLSASPHAAIVNTCSVLGVVGVPQRAAYAASKGAVAALTLAMAADHLGHGIRVNAVVPGTTDTPWVTRLLQAAPDPAAARAALRARQPTGRLVTPEEVAHAIVYLASPQAGSTTGTLLAVDGGMTGLRTPSGPAS